MEEHICSFTLIYMLLYTDIYGGAYMLSIYMLLYTVDICASFQARCLTLHGGKCAWARLCV